MSLALFFLLGDLCLLAVAVFATAASTRQATARLVYSICLAICLVLALSAATALMAGPDSFTPVQLPLGLPWIKALFRLDALSLFFLLVVNLGGAAASLYAYGYGDKEPEPQRILPFYPAFLAGMNLVLLADDAFTFLFSWEFMSLASWLLVIAHHREPGNLRAGYIYLAMAGFGTLGLLLAFGLLAGPAGDYSFASLRAAPADTYVAAWVLALTLLGAGSKAGIVPLHVWLPLAHPAAPSHVSALMSGVMTKVALYGFIRLVFDLLGEPDWWASVAILVLGGLTACLGILYAMFESDMKRLLAYSTIENVGLIFVSLGLAIAFQTYGMSSAAALALTAALFHVFNHSLFKSLLFFGAGAVLKASGERDMEKLGGLIHSMPLTAFFFLVGCIAISALPPFNGFVSEWMAFQAVLQSPELPQWGLTTLIPAIGGVLALSAALTAGVFVKAFGITFLGRPRGTEQLQAHEAGDHMLAAMAVLASLCLMAGALPGLIIDGFLTPVSMMLLDSRLPSQSILPWLSIAPLGESRSSYNGLLVLIFIVLSAALAAALVHRYASREVRRAPPWGCGYPVLPQSAQYTAASFAQPVRRVFGSYAFLAREKVTMPPPGATEPARIDVRVRDLIWKHLYEPLAGVLDRVTAQLNHLQFLTIRRYLSLVFISLVLLLVVLAIWT